MRPKGFYTIRIAAVFFLASAVFELASVGSQIPWSGAMRGGLPVVIYHVFFAAVFAATGVGLWTGTRWGYWTVFASTAIYSADKIRYLLDWQGRAAEILQLAAHTDLVEVLDMNLLLRMSALLAANFVVCWWGFAWYIYLRRAYFGRE